MRMQFQQKYVLKDSANRDLLNILFPYNQIKCNEVILEDISEYHYLDKDGLEHTTSIYFFRYIAGEQTKMGVLNSDGFNYFFQEATE